MLKIPSLDYLFRIPLWLFSHARHDISQYYQIVKKNLLPFEKVKYFLFYFLLLDGSGTTQKVTMRKINVQVFLLKNFFLNPGFSEMGPLVFCALSQ